MNETTQIFFMFKAKKFLEDVLHYIPATDTQMITTVKDLITKINEVLNSLNQEVLKNV